MAIEQRHDLLAGWRSPRVGVQAGLSAHTGYGSGRLGRPLLQARDMILDNVPWTGVTDVVVRLPLQGTGVPRRRRMTHGGSTGIASRQ